MLLVIVHRFLQAFIFPPLNAILLILCGIFLRKRFGTGVICLGLVLLYVQSIPITAYWLSKYYELPPLTASEFNQAKAIVVLQSGINDNDFEYPDDLYPTANTLIRLSYAAYLAHQDVTKIVITSGGYHGSHEHIMSSTLINAFNINNKIIDENQSMNTNENAKFVANILKPLNIKDVVIVTQAFHMRRAMMLFRKYGLNPVAGSTDYYCDDNLHSVLLSFVPDVHAMLQISRIYHEIIGYWVYKICNS